MCWKNRKKALKSLLFLKTGFYQIHEFDWLKSENGGAGWSGWVMPASALQRVVARKIVYKRFSFRPFTVRLLSSPCTPKENSCCRGWNYLNSVYSVASWTVRKLELLVLRTSPKGKMRHVKLRTVWLNMWFVLRKLIKAATFEHSAICIIWWRRRRNLQLYDLLVRRTVRRHWVNVFLWFKLTFAFHLLTSTL